MAFLQMLIRLRSLLTYLDPWIQKEYKSLLDIIATIIDLLLDSLYALLIVFEWIDDCEVSFEKMKKALVSSQLLWHLARMK